MTLDRAEIRIGVVLDDQRLADKIVWQATEADMPGPAEAGAFTLSIWDPISEDTLGIDLWTKNFPVRDMRRMMGQTLIRMGEVLGRATKDEATGMRIAELGQELLVSGEGEAERVEEPSGE